MVIMNHTTNRTRHHAWARSTGMHPFRSAVIAGACVPAGAARRVAVAQYTATVEEPLGAGSGPG